MDALTFLKEYKRMCDKNSSCNSCPLRNLMSDSTIYCFCREYIREYPEEAIKIVEKWSKENPIKTNADKFREVFGDEIPLDRSVSDGDCAGIDCPNENWCDTCPYKNFWSDPYIEREVK